MYKFRASGAAPLFLGDDGLTEKQEEELSYLQGRPNPTANQQDKMAELITKKFAEPVLSKGAQTFIKEVVEKHFYEYKSNFQGNKKTEKGNLVEDDTIAMYNLVHMKDLVKSEEELSFGPFIGHPDMLDYEDFKIPDAKSVWDKTTLPKFEEDGADTGYEWQIRLYLYMKLKMTGNDRWRNGSIFYALISTPEQLLTEWDDDSLHYVDDLDLNLRYTEVPVYLSDEDIVKIEKRGKIATKFANEYHERLLNKNKSNV